mmetsp:Transcript_103330/g.318834  ORF Transcript_103330/g.318834 Transcript_103330/m.318834 type:complete len:89 (+) Transcript_103330:139-405(+)
MPAKVMLTCTTGMDGADGADAFAGGADAGAGVGTGVCEGVGSAVVGMDVGAGVGGGVGTGGGVNISGGMGGFKHASWLPLQTVEAWPA